MTTTKDKYRVFKEGVMAGLKIPKDKPFLIKPAPRNSLAYRMGAIVGYTSLKGPYPGSKGKRLQDNSDHSEEENEDT